MVTPLPVSTPREGAPRVQTDGRLCLQLLSLSFAVGRGRHRSCILDDVDLQVAAGEMVCILGESGCGKSTLLRLIAGLERPSEGRIVLNGRTVIGPGPERGVVFQQPALFPWLSVARNVRFGLEIRGDSSDRDGRVSRMLELVGLTSAADKKPTELSGGMAQRVALARALVNEPSVLLMDEPFSALDAFTRARLQQELQSIQRRTGCTTIFVTHDIDEALTLADRIVVMRADPGRVQAQHVVPLAHPRHVESSDFQSQRRQVTALLANAREPLTEGPSCPQPGTATNGADHVQ